MFKQARNLAIVMALSVTSAAAQIFNITIFPKGDIVGFVYEPCWDVHTTIFGDISFWTFDDEGFPVFIDYGWYDHTAWYAIIREI
tara:strand:+ start:11900 stop:12154 length:255 start_codon:yes stop_codon:yes gene_type:complete